MKNSFYEIDFQFLNDDFLFRNLHLFSGINLPIKFKGSFNKIVKIKYSFKYCEKGGSAHFMSNPGPPPKKYENI